LDIKKTSIQNFIQSFKSCQDDQKEAFFWTLSTVSSILNDELTIVFKNVGGMDALVNSFVQSPKDIQKNLLTPIMYMAISYLFRDRLGKNSEFLKSLTNFLDEDDIDLTLNVAGIILSLAGYISNKEIVKTALENKIFPIIRNNQSSKGYMDKILDCLMRASSIDTSKSVLLEFGTKEIIQPFVDDENSPYHFISCVIQAFLSSNDINQNNEFGSNPISPKVISKILDVVDTFIEAQSYIYADGFFLICYHVLKAIGSLARNEANMKELKNNGIVKKIIEFIKSRKDNLLKISEKTIEELSTLIWILSFDQDCKNEFLSNGIVEILKGFNVKDRGSAKKAINGALFILIGNQNQNQNQNRSEIKGQVMISYCWEEKEKARKIAKYLQSKNIPVWIDIEQMEGSVLDKMAEAVEESSVILAFLSSKYKDSQACRTEAEYAYKLKKEIICIMAEDNYQPRGWLGALLGNKLWYNPWKNLIFDEESFSPVLSQLTKLLNQSKIAAQTQVQEKKQDQISSNISQSTNNDHQNQQILSLLEKILTKMDGFENRLQQVEIQNKENYEKLEQRFEQKFAKLENQNKENFEAIGKVESQNIENFARMETNSQQRFEQMLEKLEKKKKNVFGK